MFRQNKAIDQAIHILLNFPFSRGLTLTEFCYLEITVSKIDGFPGEFFLLLCINPLPHDIFCLTFWGTFFDCDSFVLVKFHIFRNGSGDLKSKILKDQFYFFIIKRKVSYNYFVKFVPFCNTFNSPGSFIYMTLFSTCYEQNHPQTVAQKSLIYTYTTQGQTTSHYTTDAEKKINIEF
jgi:hypothetical protein